MENSLKKRTLITLLIMLWLTLTNFYRSNYGYNELISPVMQDDNTRYLAWVLGSKVSLASVGYEAGADRSTVTSIISKVEPAAEYFGVQIPPLPYPSGSQAEFSAAILNYLLNDFGEKVGNTLMSYPTDHQYLFELAVKSNILLMLYSPHDDLTITLTNVIKDRAPKAGIPFSVYYPVVLKIENGASYNEVKAAIVKMHNDVSEDLYYNQ